LLSFEKSWRYFNLFAAGRDVVTNPFENREFHHYQSGERETTIE